MKLISALFLATVATAAPQQLTSPASPRGLLTRQQAGSQCDIGFSSSASAYEITQNMNALASRGEEECGANPGECKILQCSYNAAIQWCNTAAEYHSYKCRELAPHVQGILNHCTKTNIWTLSKEVRGVAYDVQHFEVWAGYSPC